MIRAGTIEDSPFICEMAKEFWQHTVYDEPFCDKSAPDMVALCIDHQLLSVLEIDGKIEGFACGVTGGLIGNANVKTGTEMCWWINPSHRGGGNGRELLAHLETAAKNIGVKHWNMVFMQSSMPGAVESMYQKMGYKKTEVTYSKVL